MIDLNKNYKKQIFTVMAAIFAVAFVLSTGSKVLAQTVVEVEAETPISVGEVIAAAEEPAVEVAEEEQEDNVVGLDDFESILNPSSHFGNFKQAEFDDMGGEFVAPSSSKPAAESAEKTGDQTASVKKSSLGSDMARSAGGIRPPAGFKNDGNLEKPACWRNLDSLPRTISFKK